MKKDIFWNKITISFNNDEKKKKKNIFLNKIKLNTFNIKLSNAIPSYYVTLISYYNVYYHNNRTKCIDIRQKKSSRK